MPPAPEPPAAIAAGTFAPLGIERVIGGPPRAYPRISGGVATFFESSAPNLLVYAGPDSDAPDRVVPIGAYTDSASYTDAFIGGAVVYARHGVLHWLDLTTGVERFATPLLSSPPLRPSDLFHATYALALNDTTVFVSLEMVTVPAADAELLSLSRADGSVGFRIDSPSPSSVLAATSTHLFVSEGSGTLVGLDAATGREVWRARGRARRGVDALTLLLATDERVVVVEYAGRVRVLEPTTGATRREIRLRGRTPTPVTSYGDPPTAILEGARLILPITRADEIRLAAIDLDSGATLWESPSFPYVSANQGRVEPLFVEGDAVYGCFGDGTLRGFDGTSGALLSELGLGTCELAIFPPDTDGHRRVVARWNMEWVMLARGAPLPSLESVTVHGQVTRLGSPAARVRVVVHDRAVTTDAAGNFEVEVEARGRIAVTTAMESGEVGGTRALSLDRGGRHEVDLAIVPAPPVDF